MAVKLDGVSFLGVTLRQPDLTGRNHKPSAMAGSCDSTKKGCVIFH
jgi:hypothetical protein